MEASGTGNMKFALNGALTIGTLDGANIEIRDRVGAENIFIFGLTADEVAAKRANGYKPRAVIEGSRELRRRSTAIASGVFSPDDPNRYAGLMDGLYDHDWFMVAADFDAYAAAQRAVDARWHDHAGWRASGDPQHRQRRLVLVRPHHPRICPRHLGRAVKPPRGAHRCPAGRTPRRSLLAARRP